MSGGNGGVDPWGDPLFGSAQRQSATTICRTSKERDPQDVNRCGPYPHLWLVEGDP